MLNHKIAGVVLAGGRSSRMGENKALLSYGSGRLIDHMIAKLYDSGFESVYVSGEYDGLKSISDNEIYAGPAKAITHLMSQLKSYDGIFFIPVDMPLLSPEAILALIRPGSKGTYYQNSPLPLYVGHCEVKSTASSVKDLIKDLDILAIPQPNALKSEMLNANSKKDWEEIIAR